MVNTHFQQIIENIEHIGTQPAVILKILEKSQDYDLSITEMAELLEQDPTICAQILKMANSVFFSRGQQIATIKQAVVHLGLSNVRNVLFAITLLGKFSNNLSEDRFPEDNFWKHSLAGGMIAWNYAASQKWTDLDFYYIAGLIRNIGLLAIRQFMPREFEAILNIVERDKVSFETAMRLLLDVTHRTVAFMIASRWKLPDKITLGINSPTPSQHETIEINRIKASLDIADYILEKKEYARWDPYYASNFCSQDNESVEMLFSNVEKKTEGLFKELWD